MLVPAPPLPRIALALFAGYAFLAFAAGGVALAADEQATIDFADGLFARGFNEEAADEYRAYLEEFPEGKHRLGALYRLGEAETALGRYDAAIEVFDQAMASGLGGDFVLRSRLRKGAVLIKLGRQDDALKVLGPLIGEGSTEEIVGEALYFIGKAHAEADRAASAISALSRLVREHASSPFVAMGRYQLAFAYIAQGDLEKAAVEFSEVVGTKGAGDPLRMESYYRAAESYDALGWFDAAVSAYERLERDYPDSVYAHRAHYGHAWALYEAGKVEAAMEAAEGFAAAYPDSQYRSGTLYLLGNCFQEQERYDDALGTYQDLRTSFPDSEFALRAQYKVAWVHYLKGDRASAKREVDDFLGRGKPTGLEGDAYFLEGTLLYEAQAFSEASDAFHRVYTSFPASEFASDAVFQHGDCLMRLGRHEESAEVLGNFADGYPDHPRAIEAHLRTGDAFFALRNYAEAVERYERALAGASGGPAHEEGLYRLAIAQYNQGRYAESTAVFGKLLESYTGGKYAPEANLRTGDYWLREGGDPMKAIPYFEGAYDAVPDGPYAGQALKGLALARYESKDFDGAAESFIRVMTTWSDVRLNEKTYAWVGQHLFDREDWSKALVAFEALLLHVPDYPNPERVLFKVAECTEHAGHGKDAVERYQDVVTAAPASMTALDAKYRMAHLYEAQGSMEAALRLFEEGANANNGETAARSRFRLGQIYEEREEYKTAARHYMRVAILFLHPELSPESLWRAGQCFEKGRDLEQAMKTYAEVLEEYPESAQAALAQARLDDLSGA